MAEQQNQQFPSITAKYISDAKQAKVMVNQRLDEIAAQYEQLKAQGDRLGMEKLYAEAENVAAAIPELDSRENELKAELETKIAKGTLLSEVDPLVGLDFSEEGIKKKLNQNLSALLDADVDLGKSIDWEDRRNLAFLSDQNKDEYLSAKYGTDNVKTVSVSGRPLRLIRQQDGKWLPDNELGSNLKDAWTIAGEIGPTVGSIAGGIVGTGLSATPAGTTIGGAAGYTFAGALQDQIASSVLKAGPGFLEAIPERATQAALGAALEYPVLKIGTKIGRGATRMAAGEQSEFVDILRKDQEFLASRGYKTDLANLAAGGALKNEKRLKLAYRLPDSGLGRDVLFGIKRLQTIKDDALSAVQKGGVLYDDALMALRQERDTLQGLVGLYDEQAGAALAKTYDDRIAGFATGKPKPKETVGKYIFQELKGAESRATAIKDETYGIFYQKADEAGISADPIELAKHIEKNYYGKITRNPALDAELDRLRARPRNAKRIEEIDKQLQGDVSPEIQEKLTREREQLRQLAGPLNARQLDETVRIFREAVPEGGIVGASTKQQAAGKAAENIQAFRDNLYKEAGIYGDWGEATRTYQYRMGFEQQQLGRIMQDTFGRSDLTPKEIVNTVLGDSRTLQDVLSAVSIGDPKRVTPVRQELQHAYLQKIGLSNRGGREVKDFEFDPEIVKTLYGDGNVYAGELMVKKLDNLRATVRKYGVDASKITIDDITELSRRLPEARINEVEAAIVKRAKAEMELDKMKNNALMDIALKGHREAIERGEFPSAMWSAKSDDVRKVLSRFGSKDQEMLRGDYIEHLFAKYPPTGNYGIHGNELWDGPTFIKDIAKNPTIERNLRTVAGDEFTDVFISASRLMKAAEYSPQAQAKHGGSAVVNEGGMKWFLPWRYVTEPIGARLSAAAYRMGNLTPFLSKLASKELTEEQYNKATKNLLLGLSTTTKGVEALTKSGRFDPEWAAWLGENLGTVTEQTQQYREKYGVE